MVTALRTARACHVRPFVMWGHRDSPRWDTEEILLMQALTLLEDSVCGCGCGGWTDECLSEELHDDDAWGVRVGRHWRQAVLERGRKEHKDEIKDNPGTFVYLVDNRRKEGP